MNEKKKKDVYFNIDGEEIELKVSVDEANEAIKNYVESGKIEKVYPLLKAGKTSIEVTLLKPSSFIIRMIERIIGEEVKENGLTNQEVLQIRNTAYVAAHIAKYKDKDYSAEDDYNTLENLKERYNFIEGLLPNMRTALIDRNQHFIAYCAKVFELSSLENF